LRLNKVLDLTPCNITIKLRLLALPTAQVSTAIKWIFKWMR
jgi:hypothetical protein